MSKRFPFELLEDAKALAKYREWSEQVYRDLFAVQAKTMSEIAFRKKYETGQAILILDMSGFTKSAMNEGELQSLLRILDVQKVCIPVLLAHKASHVRAFADDLYATFKDPNFALDAALEIHSRIRIFNESELASHNPAECCIGLGYGAVLRIGPDRAMGDEMNRASKLGEDTAEPYETLVTEHFFEAVKRRTDCEFEPRTDKDLPFPFFAVTPVK